MKSPRTKNKKRFSIGDYKYAMKNVKADYLLECRSLQMEKEKLNAVMDVDCSQSPQSVFIIRRACPKKSDF